MTACEVDTYDLPSETLTGRLVDTDGEPFVTDQPYGFKIRMQEDRASQFYDFWGKEDGTFRNTTIFRSKYKISPFDGALFQVHLVNRVFDGTLNLYFPLCPFAKAMTTLSNQDSSIRTTLRPYT